MLFFPIVLMLHQEDGCFQCFPGEKKKKSKLQHRLSTIPSTSCVAKLEGEAYRYDACF